MIEADENTMITFTGRVAAGMSMEKVKAFLKAFQAKGAKIVLDSKSFTLEDILEVSPWLIKPNQEEVSAYLRCAVDTVEEVANKGRIFVQNGVANTMVSLGEQGAILLQGEACYVATPPAVAAKSTIGAGDSTLAGFIAAASRGEDAAGCLRSAVAYGTAACLTPGTLPPTAEDVAKIYPQVQIRKIV